MPRKAKTLAQKPRRDAESEPVAYEHLREYLQTAEYRSRRHQSHGVESHRMQAWVDTAGFGLPQNI